MKKERMDGRRWTFRVEGRRKDSGQNSYIYLMTERGGGVGGVLDETLFGVEVSGFFREGSRGEGGLEQ